MAEAKDMNQDETPAGWAEMRLGDAYLKAMWDVRAAHRRLPQPMRGAFRVDYDRLERAAVVTLLNGDPEQFRETLQDWRGFWLEAIECELDGTPQPGEAAVGPMGQAFHRLWERRERSGESD